MMIFANIYGLKYFVKDYEDSFKLNDEIIPGVYVAAAQHELTIPFPKQEIEIVKTTFK